MVLQALVGSALAYANTAYSYNLGRYEFDSNQAQTSAHQLMNFRLAQWNLFREDVRDLFTLTTSHMSTYMVVGTLFLGFIVNFVWSGIKDFPSEPPWLLLLWGNCFISSLGYGLLCVWLAMHGSTTASSSSVRCLAQFIRPPIPTAAELKTVQYALDKYESGGVQTLLKPPDLMGVRERTSKMMKTISGREYGNLPRDSSAPPALSRSVDKVAASSSRSSASPRRSISQASATEPSLRPPNNTAFINDSIGSPCGSGPGRAATMESHARLFRKEQASFLSFDAYARVCLAGCAGQMIMAFGYFFVAYSINRLAQDSSVRWAAAVFCWGCTGMLISTSLCIFRLDLWVDRTKMRYVKGLLVLGPLLSSVAAQLWVHGNRIIVWCLVNVSILLHIAWLLLFLYEAQPTGIFRLPTSFRSVRYLDVFGYTTGDGPAAGGEGQTVPQQRRQSGLAQSEGMEDALQQLLSAGGFAEQLPESERQRLQELLRTCQETSAAQPRAPASPAVLGTWWLRCEHVGDSGQPLPYFVNARSSEVRWEAPEGAHIICIPEEPAPALGQVLPPSSENAPARPLRVSERRTSEAAESTSTSSLVNFEIEGPQATETENLGALRRPGSKYAQASMPWKYFMQSTLFMAFLWVATLIYCLVDRSYLCQPHSPPQIARRVALAWPHEHFAPVALACQGRSLFLGDRFEIFAAQLPQESLSSSPSAGEVQHTLHLALEPLLLAEDLPAPWKAFAAVCSAGRCSSLLLLDRSGRSVWERALPPTRFPASGAAGMEMSGEVRKWLLGPSLEVGLHTIALVEENTAAARCGAGRRDTRPKVPWALIATTEQSEVIVLCPRGTLLQPARRAARGLLLSDTGVDHLAALHPDFNGNLWHITQASDGKRTGSTRLWAAVGAGEVMPEVSSLPPGRNWANGMCHLQGGGLLLAAEAHEPELWYVPPDEGSALANATPPAIHAKDDRVALAVV